MKISVSLRIVKTRRPRNQLPKTNPQIQAPASHLFTYSNLGTSLIDEKPRVYTSFNTSSRLEDGKLHETKLLAALCSPPPISNSVSNISINQTPFLHNTLLDTSSSSPNLASRTSINQLPSLHNTTLDTSSSSPSLASRTSINQLPSFHNTTLDTSSSFPNPASRTSINQLPALHNTTLDTSSSSPNLASRTSINQTPSLHNTTLDTSSSSPNLASGTSINKLPSLHNTTLDTSSSSPNLASRTSINKTASLHNSCALDTSSSSSNRASDLTSDANINTNSAPDDHDDDDEGDDVPRSSSRQSRSGATSDHMGRGSSGEPASGESAASLHAAIPISVYILLLIRDLLTFLTRGGLSSMMFAMDQILRALLLVIEVVFGSTGSRVIGYPCRMAMWVYQLSLWVIYTMVELLLYLPSRVVLVYVAVLSLVLMVAPSPVLSVVTGLFTTMQWFMDLYRHIYRLLGGTDQAIAGGKG